MFHRMGGNSSHKPLLLPCFETKYRISVVELLILLSSLHSICMHGTDVSEDYIL